MFLMDIPGARQLLLRFFTVIGVVLSRISWSLQQLNSITSLWSLKMAPQLHVMVLASLQAHCLVWTLRRNKNDDTLHLNVCYNQCDALTRNQGFNKPRPLTETLYYCLLFSFFLCIFFLRFSLFVPNFCPHPFYKLNQQPFFVRAGVYC